MAGTGLYEKMHKTARDYVLSTAPKSPGSNQPDPERVYSTLSSEAVLSWGHAHFISTKPGLQGTRSPQEFVSHMSGMARTFDTWKIEIADVNVDVARMSAVVRANFYMTPKGQEAVRNEIIFWTAMDEHGEKVIRSTEFVDPVATAEIAARVEASKL